MSAVQHNEEFQNPNFDEVNILKKENSKLNAIINNLEKPGIKYVYIDLIEDKIFKIELLEVNSIEHNKQLKYIDSRLTELKDDYYISTYKNRENIKLLFKLFFVNATLIFILILFLCYKFLIF